MHVLAYTGADSFCISALYNAMFIWCFSLGGADRQRYVEGRLQVSPEPEVMSPPSSPRLRHSTFGATLDFIEALCDASSGLTAFATVSLPACMIKYILSLAEYAWDVP